MFAEYFWGNERGRYAEGKGRRSYVSYWTFSKKRRKKEKGPADHSNTAQDDSSSSSSSSSCSITNTTHSTDPIISVSGIRLRYTENPQI